MHSAALAHRRKAPHLISDAPASEVKEGSKADDRTIYADSSVNEGPDAVWMLAS
jgi:hypothetical protein